MNETQEEKVENDKTWITDGNYNRCSIEYFGNEEKARAALASLASCSGCSDCRGCSNCHACHDCSDCRGCSGCRYCSDCRDCSNCSYCSYCSDCRACCDETNRTEKSFDIPVIIDIHKQVYNAASKPNAFDMSDWHTCNTTHCRAGWVVHLAGEKGYELEKQTSSLFAAQQIYKASGYNINPCRFFDTNGAALEDMRKLAEGEK